MENTMKTRENIEKNVFDALKSADLDQQKSVKQELNKFSLVELKELFPEYSEEAEKAVEFEIKQDEDPQSPREWDQLGTMWCHHSRYSLGDKDAGNKAVEALRSIDNMSDEDKELLDLAVEQNLQYSSDRKTISTLMENYGAAFVLPLYLYDHSG